LRIAEQEKRNRLAEQEKLKIFEQNKRLIEKEKLKIEEQERKKSSKIYR